MNTKLANLVVMMCVVACSPIRSFTGEPVNPCIETVTEVGVEELSNNELASLDNLQALLGSHAFSMVWRDGRTEPVDVDLKRNRLRRVEGKPKSDAVKDACTYEGLDVELFWSVVTRDTERIDLAFQTWQSTLTINRFAGDDSVGGGHRLGADEGAILRTELGLADEDDRGEPTELTSFVSVGPKGVDFAYVAFDDVTYNTPCEVVGFREGDGAKANDECD
ncbi:MAG: hypothetical protein AAGA48_04380 [Myxococcota bacterium]